VPVIIGQLILAVIHTNTITISIKGIAAINTMNVLFLLEEAFVRLVQHLLITINILICHITN